MYQAHATHIAWSWTSERHYVDVDPFEKALVSQGAEFESIYLKRRHERGRGRAGLRQLQALGLGGRAIAMPFKTPWAQ